MPLPEEDTYAESRKNPLPPFDNIIFFFFSSFLSLLWDRLHIISAKPRGEGSRGLRVAGRGRVEGKMMKSHPHGDGIYLFTNNKTVSTSPKKTKNLQFPPEK